MAKTTDNGGFMNPNIGDAPGVAIATGEGYAQAGATEGRQAAATGQYYANIVKTAGNLAWEGYKAYEQGNQREELKNIAERTYNPETGYAGVQAEAAMNARAAEGPQLAIQNEILARVDAGESLSPQAIAELNSSNAELQRINDAKQANVLTPSAARAEMHAVVRKYAAQLPGLADQFRQQAQKYTGLDNLGLDQMQNLLHTDAGKAQEQAKVIQAEAKALWDTGAPTTLWGIPNPETLTAHLAGNTPVGQQIRTYAAAVNYQKYANGAKKEVLENKQMLSAEKAEKLGTLLHVNRSTQLAQGSIDLARALSKSGVDLSTASVTSLTRGQLGKVQAAVQNMYTTAARAVSADMEMVKNAVADGSLSAADGQKLLDQGQKMVESYTKFATQPVSEAFNSLKLLAGAENLSLDSMAKKYELRQKIFKDAIPTDWQANLLDTRKRGTWLKENANNPLAQKLGNLVEQWERQGTADLELLSGVTAAVGAVTAAGVPQDKRTAAQQEALETLKKTNPAEYAATMQLAKNAADEVLKNAEVHPDPSIAEKVRNATVTKATVWSPRDESEVLDLTKRIKSGAWDGVTGEYAERSRGMIKGRAERFLSPGQGSVLRDLVLGVYSHSRQGNTRLSMTPSGELVLTTKDGAPLGVDYQLEGARRVVPQLNNLTNLTAALGGDRVARAKKVIEDYNKEMSTVSSWYGKGGFTPTYGTSVARNKPFDVYAAELKGLSLEDQEKALKEKGLPPQFVEAIMRDLAGKK